MKRSKQMKPENGLSGHFWNIIVHDSYKNLGIYDFQQIEGQNHIFMHQLQEYLAMSNQMT